MRSTPRLQATVKSAARYLEAYTPTGLTGLNTHPSPRPALLYTYHQTLQKLKQLPANSVYRQSTEALTKHRLKVVEEIKPPGHAEWLQRVQNIIKSDPTYKQFVRDDGSLMHDQQGEMVETITWDGLHSKADARREGSNTQTEAEQKAKYVQEDVERVAREEKEGIVKKISDLEIEPALTSEQYVYRNVHVLDSANWNRIDEIETKLGAGLIEEVVQVAEGELLVVEEMLASRA